MQKINQGHPMSQSPDFVKENIELLKSLFPTIVKEGKIVMEELEALLGEDVEKEEEYYNFTWAGKSMARREANKPSTATLRPDKSESKDWDTTGNIYIEGDNLEVLKLLQKSYNNKIKVIYIDPPYNTGKDFVYRDNYTDNLSNYLKITGQADDEGKRNSTNAEADGRFHSNWLNMIYPRLKLARNLLTDDGVIFISIDDNEHDNLLKIGKEIFGETNFLASFTWVKKKKGSHLSKTHRSMTEYVVLFAKNINKIELFGEEAYSNKWQPIVKRTNSKKDLVFPAGKVLTILQDGEYEIGLSSDTTSAIEFKNKIVVKDGIVINELLTNAPYVWTQEKLNSEIELGSKIALSKKFGFNVLRHDQDEKIKRPSTLLDSKSEIGTNEDAYLEGIELFGQEGVMSYPKPVTLIYYLIRSNSFFDKESIILDFFSGSATTAEAVLKLNSNDNGKRKFIQVQLPERLQIDEIAFKAGFTSISEIGKERIRRAGDKILDSKRRELVALKKKSSLIYSDDESERIEELESTIQNLDTGFKVFKLDSSNIRTWDGNPEKLEENLFTAGKNIKEDRTEEDVLFEILLKYGLDLTVPIEEKSVNGKMVYSVGYGTLFICLSNNITTEVADAIGQWKEKLEPPTSRVIFKDSGFDDVQKTNSIQILKRFGINEVNTI